MHENKQQLFLKGIKAFNLKYHSLKEYLIKEDGLTEEEALAQIEAAEEE